MTKEPTPKKNALGGVNHVQSLRSFHTDLECLRELYTQIIPILEQTDRERHEKADALFAKYAKPDPNDSKKMVAELPTEENKIFVETISKIKRASTLFRRNMLVSVIARYEEYLAEQLRLAFGVHPERFASSDKAIPYRDITSWGNDIKPIDVIISREVDDLMRVSAEDQLKQVDKEFKLGLFPGFADVARCIEACERRNLYAHTGGVVSKLYLEKVKSIGYQWKDGKAPEVGVRLGVSKEYFDRAVDVFTILSVRLTQGLLRRLFPEEKAPADNLLIDVGFSKLESENYSLAEKIFDFALEIPEKFIADDQHRKIFLINRCIALYYQDRTADMEKSLAAVDWSAMHPKFLLAVHTLRRQWNEAIEIMGKADLTEKEFINWPLFRDFRKTEEFRAKFKILFGKDPTYEPRPEVEQGAKTAESAPPIDPPLPDKPESVG